MKSPTQYAVEECRARGWVPGIVEKWNPHAQIRQDLWGWCDIVALDPRRGETHFIQVTTGSNHAARRVKILAWEHLHGLTSQPTVRAHVWSYSKRVVYRKDGSKAKRPARVLREETVHPPARPAGPLGMRVSFWTSSRVETQLWTRTGEEVRGAVGNKVMSRVIAGMVRFPVSNQLRDDLHGR